MLQIIMLFITIIYSEELVNSSQINISKNWFQEPSGWIYPMDINIPDSITPNEGFPVCILLHGFGGNGAQFIQQYQNILNNHILIAPTGYLNSWNISDEPSEAPDLEMIADLVNQLQSYDNINPDKIRIIGFSNGSALANRIFIENSNSGIDIICTIVSQLSEAQYHDNNFYYPANETGGNQEFDGYNNMITPILGRKYLNIGNINDPIIPYYGGEAVGVIFLNSLNAAFIIAKSQGYDGNILSEGGVQLGNSSVYEYNYLSNQIIHLKGNSGHNIDNFQREYLIDFLNYSQIIGDLNNDGVVNNSDFLMLLSFVIGGNDSISAADINFDSEVDIFDLLLLSDFIQNM